MVQQRKNQSCQSKNKSCLISSALDKKHSELLTYEQNYDFLEIIVIDDNPNQNSNSTEKIVNEIVGGNNAKIKYIKNKKNIGISNAHKLGFSEAQGKYIVFYDDDDYYSNAEWLTKAVNIMVADPELAFVGARVLHLLRMKKEKITYHALEK
ncbi:CDP-glycerol glycerophosphotransferase [Lactobacillus brevis] [Leuconostoc pseudomesenteroides]|nr:CDP-glycerol glycerophosphotransferase [Lactobacillus brevis] [Leuconostoc pseudomesenteroides]